MAHKFKFGRNKSAAQKQDGNLKTKKKETSDLKKLVVILACAGLIGGVGAYRSILQENNQKPPEEVPTDTVPALPPVKNSIAVAAYHNDTIYKAQSTLMLYLGGKITRYYMEGNNSFRMQMPYFVHEWWHYHNALLKYRTSYDLSPDEYFKLCMHDEISANLAAILTARFEYLASNNKKDVIKYYKNTYMKFYFEAVEKGQIKPASNNPIDREKEWYFLANGVRDMWMEKFYKIYLPRTIGMVDRFIVRRGLVENSKSNYEYIKHKMFTIGGVDFAKYMDTDIMPHDYKVQLAENVRHIADLREGGKETVDNIYKRYPVLNQMGVDEQNVLFQHILIAARLNTMFKDVDVEDLKQNPNIVTSYYKHIYNTFKRDKNYKKLVNELPSITSSPLSAQTDAEVFNEAVKQVYTFKGVDLTTLIQDFNARRVPYKELQFTFDDPQIVPPQIWPYTPEVMALEDMKKRSVKKENKNQTSTPVDVSKQHISEDFYIRIPDFRDNILLNPSAENLEEIYAMMREFSAIPAVLKSCDTPAKKRFLTENPDTIAKLKLGKGYAPK
ncbi:MAG: hypothetical protein J6Y91_06890 [Alphaproteobacteria bacterium]|nr:hypothetical protein [Alphaproteobacteria bacterium]MBP5353466.1 hypothetical protein [Alphaproteobacteria bacterium]